MLPSAPRRLRYVDAVPPAAGSSIEIARGVRWARIALPIELSHINVWLLETAAGSVLVDTGIAAAVGKEAWEALEREALRSRPLQAVLITHIHPDHIGLAAWLQERHGVPVLMSARTHELARALLGGIGATPPEEIEAFLRAHGFLEAAQVMPIFRGERLARLTSGLPEVERYLEDGEVLPLTTHAWTAMRTDGHAEGHLCLWSEAACALISGDQVLPTISSNVSLSWRGDRNPLGSYLASLERLRRLPADTLVLPSHGTPFYGLQQRIDDVSAHHARQLERIAKLCAEPRCAGELLPRLFRPDLKGLHLFLALGEALAHLEYLVHARQLERRTIDGVVRYAA